jgi:hypothetical protein
LAAETKEQGSRLEWCEPQRDLRAQHIIVARQANKHPDRTIFQGSLQPTKSAFLAPFDENDETHGSCDPG